MLPLGDWLLGEVMGEDFGEGLAFPEPFGFLGEPPNQRLGPAAAAGPGAPARSLDGALLGAVAPLAMRVLLFIRGEAPCFLPRRCLPSPKRLKGSGAMLVTLRMSISITACLLALADASISLSSASVDNASASSSFWLSAVRSANRAWYCSSHSRLKAAISCSASLIALGLAAFLSCFAALTIPLALFSAAISFWMDSVWMMITLCGLR
mmetsp:Transcript_16976/g.34330  ORF Transcript_16976/g.34330 Transcript_16976/m.34330 type:complete len:209 (-) Transcript_16976:63-689(-)